MYFRTDSIEYLRIGFKNLPDDVIVAVKFNDGEWLPMDVGDTPQERIILVAGPTAEDTGDAVVLDSITTVAVKAQDNPEKPTRTAGVIQIKTD